MPKTSFVTLTLTRRPCARRQTAWPRRLECMSYRIAPATALLEFTTATRFAEETVAATGSMSSSISPLHQTDPKLIPILVLWLNTEWDG